MKIRMIAAPHRGQRGILLIECIIYLGLFFVVVGLAFQLFYACWDNARSFRRNADQIIGTLNAGERWRDDVRSANAALRAEDSPAGLLLHIPQQRGEVVYRYSSGSIRRRGGTMADWTQILAGVKSSRMELDKRQLVTAWRWEVELTVHRSNTRMRPLFSFEAVPPRNN